MSAHVYPGTHNQTCTISQQQVKIFEPIWHLLNLIKKKGLYATTTRRRVATASWGRAGVCLQRPQLISGILLFFFELISLGGLWEISELNEKKSYVGVALGRCSWVAGETAWLERRSEIG